MKGASLFLDFDGTLAGFTSDPEATRLGEGRLERLIAVHERLDGRLAVVSGRALNSLSARIGDERIALIGSHGMEARIEGVRETWGEAPERLGAALAELEAFAADQGLLYEEKPFGAALHWRQYPARGDRAALMVRRIAELNELGCQFGDHVAELRVPGGDKGDALTRLMRRAPFSTGVPVMVGDDLTDEHGFAAAQALGGHGVLVGSREGSRARHRLADVDAVWEWLG
ncbi:trehalose-phosphatase [Sphingomicrobium arenosum]|uniref:trehalose-phosphatase n=1 Tax=Sphingomicrobium arenosum TaxID=2233861 RepID=UPI00223EF8D9|nr:trehalose-phosphatase [Sphingomicrobium arenosum]